MPASSVPAVKMDAVTGVELLHQRHQVPTRRFHQEMEVIAHEDIGIQTNRMEPNPFLQFLQERVPIGIGPADRTPLIPTRSYVVRQLKVVRRMLKASPAGFEGGMTAKKYMGTTGTSKPTAH